MFLKILKYLSSRSLLMHEVHIMSDTSEILDDFKAKFTQDQMTPHQTKAMVETK